MPRAHLLLGLIGLTALCGASERSRAEGGDPVDMPATGCAAIATTPWTAVAGRVYRIGAIATGRTCAAANVTLTVRSPTGGTLLTFASAAADLPPMFVGVAAPSAMASALRRWIAQTPGRTMRDLPAWNDGAAEPAAGERPFHPEPLITRSVYAEWRKRGLPVACFVQGADSEGCYVLDDKRDRLILLGTRERAG